MEYKLYNTKYGKFLLNEVDLVSDTLIRDKFWEDELLDVFNKYLNNDSIVIEVGSYIGDHTVYLSKKCKFVYAFEGYLKTYYQLISSLFLNECWNVYPKHAVVGNGELYREASRESQDIWFPVWENNAAGARFVINAGVDYSIKLDDLKDKLFKPVTMIKTDVEGMDLNVLKGAYNIIQENRPIIIFEYNVLVAEPLDEYYKFFDEISYNVTKIGEWNWLAIPKERDNV